MPEQQLTTRVGRGPQYRRQRALRELQRRSAGVLRYVEYRRVAGSAGQYVVKLEDGDALVLDGPSADAFIAGFEYGAAAVGRLAGMDDTTNPAAGLAVASMTEPVTATEPHRRPLAVPVLRLRHQKDGWYLVWSAVADAGAYAVRYKRRHIEPGVWKPATRTTHTRVAAPNQPGIYVYEVRSLPAADSLTQPSAWSEPLEFVVSADGAAGQV